MKRRAVVYVHGKGGNAREAEAFRPYFPGDDVIGFDYAAETPWGAETEFSGYFAKIAETYRSYILIANSIGALFSLYAIRKDLPERAYLVSPVADMEGLILSMMRAAGVTEEELRERGEIAASGETLSWEYLSYVRSHPIAWCVPTRIVAGGQDALSPPCGMADFAARIGASLSILPAGGHWFHTDEEMDFLFSVIEEGERVAKNDKNGR